MEFRLSKAVVHRQWPPTWDPSFQWAEKWRGQVQMHCGNGEWDTLIRAIKSKLHG